MAEWLKACGVDTVAIEATGVYWVPIYEVLEDAGIEAFLFDRSSDPARERRKTDVLDCQWSQKLHSHGLLTRAFRPDKEIATLRAYWRQRGGIVECCARQIHLMHKALEEMNIQLHKAVTDITGVTGMRILRAIVAGERDVHALAALRRGRIKATTEEIARALEEPTARSTCLLSPRRSKPTISSSANSRTAPRRWSAISPRCAPAQILPPRRLLPSNARTNQTLTFETSSPESPGSTFA